MSRCGGRLMRWLFGRLVDLFVTALLWALGVLALKRLSLKLGENAVIGWMDDRIGEKLHISAPSAEQVVEVGLPLLGAVAVMLLYHWYNGAFDGLNRQRVRLVHKAVGSLKTDTRRW